MSNKRKLPMKFKPMMLVAPDHPVLTEVAAKVDMITPPIQALARRLSATLVKHKAKALAIAAPQCGHCIQLVAVYDPIAGGIGVVANPRIHEVYVDDGFTTEEEGCLTFPDRFFLVPRANHVEVRAIDVISGRMIRRDVVGLQARMWQHEIDHLTGDLLVIDGVSRFPEVVREAPDA